MEKREIPEEDLQILHASTEPMTTQELAAYRNLLSFLASTDERSLALFILKVFEFRAVQQHQGLTEHIEAEFEFLQYCVLALQSAGIQGNIKQLIDRAFGFAGTRHWFKFLADDYKKKGLIFPERLFYGRRFQMSAVGRKYLAAITNNIAVDLQGNAAPSIPSINESKECEASKFSTPEMIKKDPDFDNWKCPRGKAAIHNHFIKEIRLLYREIGFEEFKADSLQLGDCRREYRTDWFKAMADFGYLEKYGEGSARTYRISMQSQK